MVILKRKVFGAQIEVQAQDFKGVCKADDFIGRQPQKCSVCGNSDLHFYYKKPKGFDYYGVRCRGCGAEQAYHTKQEDGSFFIKWDDKFEKFGDGPRPQKSDDGFQDDDPGDDIPF